MDLLKPFNSPEQRFVTRARQRWPTLRSRTSILRPVQISPCIPLHDSHDDLFMHDPPVEEPDVSDESDESEESDSDSRPAQVKGAEKQVSPEKTGEKRQAAIAKPALVVVLAAPSHFLASLKPRRPGTIPPPIPSSRNATAVPRRPSRVKKTSPTSNHNSHRRSTQIASQVGKTPSSPNRQFRRRSQRIASRVASSIIASAKVQSQTTAEKSHSGPATEDPTPSP